MCAMPAYDVDSGSENENEPFRRDSDVQVVDLTEEEVSHSLEYT